MQEKRCRSSAAELERAYVEYVPKVSMGDAGEALPEQRGGAGEVIDESARLTLELGRVE